MRSARRWHAEIWLQPRQAFRLRASRDRADRHAGWFSIGLRSHGRQHLGQDDTEGVSGQDRKAIRQGQTHMGEWIAAFRLRKCWPRCEIQKRRSIIWLARREDGSRNSRRRFLTKPWEDVRESVRVKLIEHGEETYVFVRSEDRRDKEQSMRRRRLKKLIKRLRELQQQNLTRDELLLKLGAARKEAGKAYALLVIYTPTKDQPVTSETFHFALDRKKLRQARRREGGYLLRSIADAVLDRLVHTAHRLALDGETRRKPPQVPGA